MAEALHHLHKRKRIHQKKEKYPHPHRFKRIVDHVVYAFGVIAPFMGAIQSYKIWTTHNAEAIALSTYVFFIVNNAVWFAYGVIHKEKPLIIAYTLWFFVNISIVVGTILYG